MMQSSSGETRYLIGSLSRGKGGTFSRGRHTPMMLFGKRMLHASSSKFEHPAGHDWIDAGHRAFVLFDPDGFPTRLIQLEVEHDSTKMVAERSATP